MNSQTDEVESQLALVTKTRFGPGDVLVIRVAADTTMYALEIIDGRVRDFKRAAKVDAPHILIAGDVDLFALPDVEARQLYDHLRRRFANG